MALEVARAYDADKNLVPLYILTDGDQVYDPVTPGFTWAFDNYGETLNSPADLVFSIISDAMNPTGGNITLDGERHIFTTDIWKTANPTVTLKINNQTPFDIKISLTCTIQNSYYSSGYRYHDVYTININGIEVPKDSEISSVTFTNSPYDSENTDYYFMKSLYIQRMM